MSEFFAYLAAIDDTAKVARRKVMAVANKRVNDTLGDFLRSSSVEEFKARYALVEDDVKRIAAEVVAEYDSAMTPEDVESVIKEHLAGGNADHLKEFQFKPKGENQDVENEDESQDDEEGSDSDGTTASVREARRPKMCPYHSEVVDVSLGTGDPQAGYNALQTHAWGDNHCKGGYAGTCNFRPQMVTQKFWDDKQDEYKQRAEERRFLQEGQPTEPNIATEPIMTQEPLEEGPGEGVTDINGDLEEAPSAIGSGEPVMASTHQADADRDGGGAVTRESLPTGNESALSGPSPKMDHKEWKPNALNDEGNLKPIDTEKGDSPHPTTDQDIEAAPEWKNQGDDNFLEQTDAVTESQELPEADESGQTTERNTEQPHTDTWTEAENQPVTSSVDPEKNPIREILEDQYQGFVAPDQAQSAISEYESS